MVVYCPKLKCGGTKDITCCLYRCPITTVRKCEEYTRVFPQINEIEIDEKYIAMYGPAMVVVPIKYLRRKRRVPKA